MGATVVKEAVVVKERAAVVEKGAVKVNVSHSGDCISSS